MKAKQETSKIVNVTNLTSFIWLKPSKRTSDSPQTRMKKIK